MSSRIKKGLYYTGNHEWVSIEEDTVTVGITDYAQDSLGEIVYVELPETDEQFSADDEVASIESVKTAAPVYAPFSGTIAEVNEDLEDSPELINSDPYETFIYVMKVDGDIETDDLMDSEAYKEFLAAQEDD